MNKLKFMATLLAFTASPLLATNMVTGVLFDAGCSLPRQTSRQIEFTVALRVGLPRAPLASDASNINFDCSWHNVSSAPVDLLLKDHDGCQGTLSYPVSLQVRIVGPDGKVLTPNSAFSGGWWDFSCLCSQFSKLMPGDIVTLQPNETVTRTVHLTDVLSGVDFAQAAKRAPLAANGSRDLTKTPIRAFSLPPGDSKLEVRLFDLVAVAPITLHIETPEPAR